MRTVILGVLPRELPRVARENGGHACCEKFAAAFLIGQDGSIHITCPIRYVHLNQGLIKVDGHACCEKFAAALLTGQDGSNPITCPIRYVHLNPLMLTAAKRAIQI